MVMAIMGAREDGRSRGGKKERRRVDSWMRKRGDRRDRKEDGEKTRKRARAREQRRREEGEMSFW